MKKSYWKILCVAWAGCGMHLAQASGQADMLMDRAKAATGGPAWNTLLTQDADFEYTLPKGIRGSGNQQIDLRAEKYAEHIQMTALLTLGLGWDGNAAWQEDSGKVTNAGAAGKDVFYRNAYAYWFAGGRIKRQEFAGRQHDRGVSYDVVHIVPAEGQPFDFWINASSHRIERRLDSASGISTEYGDFRTVGDVIMPFSEQLSDDGHGNPVLRRYVRYTFNKPVSQLNFQKPVPESIQGFDDGKPVTVPFERCEGHICLRVMLNGEGPFRFLLDTGGRNLMSGAVFEHLQLKRTGSMTVYGTGKGSDRAAVTTVNEVGLGTLSLRKQGFVVADALNRTDFDGVIGYEWFQRCPILLDYPARQVTLYEPASFAYRGRAQGYPLQFEGTTPTIRGKLDGMDGLFAFDTGSYLSLTLSRGFIEQFALDKKYGIEGAPINSMGMGGGNTLLPARGGGFSFGGVTIREPALELSTSAEGSIGGSKFAGNIGNQMMSQLRLLFDYGKQLVYIEQ